MINPVRYPGGKGSKSIVERIIALYPEDYLQDRIWVEPFCGGCGLGLALLERGIVSKCVFNDGDPRIHDMWHEIIYNTDEIIRKINDASIDMDLFRSSKTIANDPASSVEVRGFATYCLNRMCRSGYIDGGVIGGNDQSGNYKCDCRFNKKTLTRNIAKIGKISDEGRIILAETTDACEFVAELLKGDISGISADEAATAFYYVDPPYYKMGASCYRQGVDHDLLAKWMREGAGKDIEWLLSYDDCPEVRALYEGCQFDYLDITYSNNTQTRGKAREILIHK